MRLLGPGVILRGGLFCLSTKVSNHTFKDLLLGACWCNDCGICSCPSEQAYGQAVNTLGCL